MTVGKTCLGIDAGIESFVATSRGDLIKAPRFLLKVQSKLKLLQRRLKHQVKGSNNWLKLQEKIARLHEKVSNTRRDWHFKLAHYLCDMPIISSLKILTSFPGLEGSLENNLEIRVSVVLLTRYYRLSLGNGANIILKSIKTELPRIVLIVAQLLVKKSYRKEFTNVILAATSNREIRHQRR